MLEFLIVNIQTIHLVNSFTNVVPKMALGCSVPALTTNCYTTLHHVSKPLWWRLMPYNLPHVLVLSCRLVVGANKSMFSVQSFPPTNSFFFKLICLSCNLGYSCHHQLLPLLLIRMEVASSRPDYLPTLSATKPSLLVKHHILAIDEAS